MATIPGPGDFVLSGLESLVTAYSVNLEWDVEWALNWDLADGLHSRNDNTWVIVALLSGVYHAYDISIPFTDIGFNPLDWFSDLPRPGDDQGPAGRATMRVEVVYMR